MHTTVYLAFLRRDVTFRGPQITFHILPHFSDKVEIIGQVLTGQTSWTQKALTSSTTRMLPNPKPKVDLRRRGRHIENRYENPYENLL